MHLWIISKNHVIGFLTFDELSSSKKEESDISNDDISGVKRMKEALQEREQVRSQQKRSGVSEAWVWHDDDEMLAYEDLLEDFHQR